MPQINAIGWELEQTIKIAQAHASSGSTRPVERVMEEVYTVLKALNNEQG